MVEMLGGEGFDVIIEHLANINLGHDVQMLKPGARIMVVGCRGSVTINPRHLMLPEASIHGVGKGFKMNLQSLHLQFLEPKRIKKKI